jgi:hypothetical protein
VGAEGGKKGLKEKRMFAHRWVYVGVRLTIFINSVGRSVMRKLREGGAKAPILTVVSRNHDRTIIERLLYT